MKTQAGRVSAEMHFPAQAEYLAGVRRQVEEIAAPSRLSRDDVDDLLTAVDEAVANAIRHGSPRGPENHVRVTCHGTEAGVEVEVEDEGKGFSVPASPRMPGPEAPGGRGLPLMRALADRVEVASTRRGTRVTLKKRASVH